MKVSIKSTLFLFACLMVSSNANAFYCSGGDLYASINQSHVIGRFEDPSECVRAVTYSKNDHVCAGDGVLKNAIGNTTSIGKYPTQEQCVESLWYSNLTPGPFGTNPAPAGICSGKTRVNFAGGFLANYTSEEECLHSMGKPY